MVTTVRNPFAMASLGCSSVFITGCNRGIGLAFVKHILNLPSVPKHIFATCRSLKAENARELADLAQKHSNLHVLEFDASDVSSGRLPEIVEKVEATLADFGLNLLINNAGINIRESFKDVTAESMTKCYKVNTIAPLMITKAFLPLLQRAASVKDIPSQPRAAVVNISSILGSIELNSASRKPIPYCASKAALNMVTKSFSIDLAKDGIIAVAVHPGWVQTDMGGKNGNIMESIFRYVETAGVIGQIKKRLFLEL